MSKSPYHCDCHNSQAMVNAKFRSFDADGNHFDEVHVRSGATEHLKLAAETGNTIKIERWDNGWSDPRCYGDIGMEDNVLIEGALDGFQVYLNSHHAHPIDCPSS